MTAGHRDADIAIAGGGLVGLTLGLALAQGGLNVAVADPLNPEQLADERFDGRVSALEIGRAHV